MVEIEEHEFVDGSGEKAFYLAAGPPDGQLIILCHGWPALAKTWKAQIEALSTCEYRVVAPDMPGHDWGAAAVWSFASHYPERTTAAAGLARPYHTLEYGLEEVLKTVNRDIYPADRYPYAQYDYQVYFEQAHNAVSDFMDQDPAGILRAIYAIGRPDEVGKPGLTATVTSAGGWFGGAKAPPAALRQIPSSALCLDKELLGEVTYAMTKTGFWSANAWYLNHQRNRAYSLETAKSDGYLNMPVLFIGANWDPISDISVSSIAEAQKKYCPTLKEVRLDTGHWPALEKPAEVNAAILDWLRENGL